jgi:hypothetical protein
VSLLTERYAEKINGVISCYDRIIIQGTLPGLCYAEGMTKYLSEHKIRIFDYARFAEPLRDQLREQAERLAREHDLEIEFLRSHKTRKEALIQQVLKERGDHPGLVAILSAMEICPTYKPWHDKQSHRTFLKADQSKCLHYYFYFIDPELGLCYLRVPTWCPFRLQFYFNGHHWLASQLRAGGINYTLRDNAFTQLADWEQAQELSDRLDVTKLHQRLDELAARYCPVLGQLGVTYHWSLHQVEYATDIVFKRQSDLADLYQELIRTAIHAVKPEHVATFLGRTLHGNFADELGNRFDTRISGTRLKHQMGPASIKVYDKFSLILRIETTTNDVSFFKHYREVEHRDHSRRLKWAPLKKTIYSLEPLSTTLRAANRRYLEFLSALDDTSDGARRLRQVTRSVLEHERSYKGLNFFAEADQTLLEVLARGEFSIRGFQNKDLRRFFTEKSCGQLSRLLKRLRVHGLVKKVGSTYRYYLTSLGKQVILAGLKLKELFLAPQLSAEARA